MSETNNLSLEKSDILPPQIEAGGTAIVLQRHERYERDRGSDISGSIFSEAATAAFERDLEFFDTILEGQTPEQREQTFALFVSSPTQYNGMGRRSLETTQLAQDAAAKAFQEHGIDAETHIINLNGDFGTHDFEETEQKIRPLASLEEPRIFEKPAYVDFLRDNYGPEEGAGTGISTAAWAAHESDVEVEERLKHGAEGVDDMLARTEHSMDVLTRYAEKFHKLHPDSRLIIWAGTHYDTLSPLLKKLTGTSRDDYVKVDYGGGMVVELSPDGSAKTSVGGMEIPIPRNRPEPTKSET